jgi:hypothetical protein
MTDQTIYVEEELREVALKTDEAARRWTEEFSVRGGDLRDALGRLAREARARKITIKSQSGQTLAEIPLVLGAAGVLIIGSWTAVLLAAAWLARVSILIEYEEAPAVESAVEQIEARIA